MLKLVLFTVFFASDVLCFVPNCISENQYKFYSFPVEGCSEYLKELCIPIYTGRFEVISSPTIVKVKATAVLPTCAFYNIDTLQHIYGVKSNIKVLAKGAFVNLPKLKSINLSYNQIMEVRDQVFQNVSTEKLDLSWNNIIFIDPDAFKEISNLKDLDLSRNSLITIPINQLSRSVSNLNLAYNKLTRIALNSIRFTNLSNINLSHNQIQNIAISFFYGIDTIDLTNNKLYDIDYVEIRSVKNFRIGSNNFRMTPKYLQNINAVNMDIYPNPWSCEELPELWRFMTSLNYKIETTDSAPDTMAICTNVSTVGAVRGENNICINDRQCSENQVCKVGQCLDPCSSFCHQSNICKTKNHRFKCTCPRGMKTDPMDLTGACNRVQCYVNSHCPNSKSCVQNRCIKLPGVLPTIPTPSYLPEETPDVKPWWFEDIPHETPIKILDYVRPILVIEQPEELIPLILPEPPANFTS